MRVTGLLVCSPPTETQAGSAREGIQHTYVPYRRRGHTRSRGEYRPSSIWLGASLTKRLVSSQPWEWFRVIRNCRVESGDTCCSALYCTAQYRFSGRECGVTRPANTWCVCAHREWSIMSRIFCIALREHGLHG